MEETNAGNCNDRDCLWLWIFLVTLALLKE